VIRTYRDVYFATIYSYFKGVCWKVKIFAPMYQGWHLELLPEAEGRGQQFQMSSLIPRDNSLLFHKNPWNNCFYYLKFCNQHILQQHRNNILTTVLIVYNCILPMNHYHTIWGNRIVTCGVNGTTRWRRQGCNS
jgi:hypothetical protein